MSDSNDEKNIKLELEHAINIYNDCKNMSEKMNLLTNTQLKKQKQTNIIIMK